jgi:hypothetical protein
MFTISLFSEGQILTGINYLQGTETIGEKDIPSKEIQVGLFFVVFSLTIYKKSGVS